MGAHYRLSNRNSDATVAFFSPSVANSIQIVMVTCSTGNYNACGDWIFADTFFCFRYCTGDDISLTHLGSSPSAGCPFTLSLAKFLSYWPEASTLASFAKLDPSGLESTSQSQPLILNVVMEPQAVLNQQPG